MHKEVFIGKTYEEAKQEACKKLNAKEEELIIIEKEVKKVLFNKKVEIYAIEKSVLNKDIKEFISNLIKNMGMSCSIEVKTREENVVFNIVSPNSSILIGKNGKTIDALQIITNQMVSNEIGTYYRFLIDVNDYKQKRKIRLEKLAKYTAKDVAKTKVEVKLEAMNSYERRIIHNALSNSEDVITESTGEEPNRCVVIKPKED